MFNLNIINNFFFFRLWTLDKNTLTITEEYVKTATVHVCTKLQKIEQGRFYCTVQILYILYCHDCVIAVLYQTDVMCISH